MCWVVVASCVCGGIERHDSQTMESVTRRYIPRCRDYLTSAGVEGAKSGPRVKGGSRGGSKVDPGAGPGWIQGRVQGGSRGGSRVNPGAGPG